MKLTKTKLKEIIREEIQKLNEATLNEASDKIQVQGVGVYDYKTLSKKVVKMLKDLEKRANKEDFGSVGKSQLNTLTAMWIALKQYGEKQ